MSGRTKDIKIATRRRMSIVKSVSEVEDFRGNFQSFMGKYSKQKRKLRKVLQDMKVVNDQRKRLEIENRALKKSNERLLRKLSRYHNMKVENEDHNNDNVEEETENDSDVTKEEKPEEGEEFPLSGRPKDEHPKKEKKKEKVVSHPPKIKRQKTSIWDNKNFLFHDEEKTKTSEERELRVSRVREDLVSMRKGDSLQDIMLKHNIKKIVVGSINFQKIEEEQDLKNIKNQYLQKLKELEKKEKEIKKLIEKEIEEKIQKKKEETRRQRKEFLNFIENKIKKDEKVYQEEMKKQKDEEIKKQKKEFSDLMEWEKKRLRNRVNKKIKKMEQMIHNLEQENEELRRRRKEEDEDEDEGEEDVDFDISSPSSSDDEEGIFKNIQEFFQGLIHEAEGEEEELMEETLEEEEEEEEEDVIIIIPPSEKKPNKPLPTRFPQPVIDDSQEDNNESNFMDKSIEDQVIEIMKQQKNVKGNLTIKKMKDKPMKRPPPPPPKNYPRRLTILGNQMVRGRTRGRGRANNIPSRTEKM